MCSSWWRTRKESTKVESVIRWPGLRNTQFPSEIKKKPQAGGRARAGDKCGVHCHQTDSGNSWNCNSVWNWCFIIQTCACDLVQLVFWRSYHHLLPCLLPPPKIRFCSNSAFLVMLHFNSHPCLIKSSLFCRPCLLTGSTVWSEHNWYVFACSRGREY